MSKSRIELSAVLTVVGVILLFLSAIIVTLIAPEHIDPSWKQASSSYQVQMYDVSDPNVYVSTSNPRGAALQYVYHLKEGFTLSAFQESPLVRIVAPPELEKYVTRVGNDRVKLTSKVLLLRTLEDDAKEQERLRSTWKGEGTAPHFTIYELYDPKKLEAFAITQTDGIVENWIDNNFTIDQPPPYDVSEGTIYVNNPIEYRVREMNYYGTSYWLYNENGQRMENIEELKEGKMRFLSRKALIHMGENIFRAEGCWYCHTDQTRTLVQDTVLNGSASYPAPPSSANEYIFQRVTFPGTRRIGPDLSRVGVKRPHRDWHQSHFWSPKTESKGSIMPAFKHFFDDDPSGAPTNPYGLPNYQFEAIFQYLMTKGTRITSPTHAWWLGRDPVQTIDIIEGRKN